MMCCLHIGNRVHGAAVVKMSLNGLIIERKLVEQSNKEAQTVTRHRQNAYQKFDEVGRATSC